MNVPPKPTRKKLAKPLTKSAESTERTDMNFFKNGNDSNRVHCRYKG